MGGHSRLVCHFLLRNATASDPMSLDADLMAILLDAADGLPLVERKRMFGFEALWGDGRIFAMVWQGRISLRLPDRAAAAELARVPGATALTIAEGKTTAAGQRWINVPESFHDDPHELAAMGGTRLRSGAIAAASTEAKAAGPPRLKSEHFLCTQGRADAHRPSDGYPRQPGGADGVYLRGGGTEGRSVRLPWRYGWLRR